MKCHSVFPRHSHLPGDKCLSTNDKIVLIYSAFFLHVMKSDKLELGDFFIVAVFSFTV